MPTWLPSTLPPLSTARSTTTEPGRMLSTMARLTRRGAGRPGICAVVITRSWFFEVLGDHVGLLLPVLLGQLLGVAARGRRVLLDHADELGAEALDLLLGRGPDVGRRDHRAQAARRGDRLQTGDPGADHEHLGRRHGAGRGHQHRHHPIELGEAVDQRAIAGEIGLAGQDIHRLGAGGARQQFQRKGDHARLGIGRDLLGMLIGVEHADQNLTRAQQRHLVDLALAGGERPPHLEQDVRLAIERGGIVHQLRARVGEALVGEPGAVRRRPLRPARRCRDRPGA